VAEKFFLIDVRKWKDQLPCRRKKFEMAFVLSLMLILIYLLTAVGLTPGGSSTVHIYIKQYIEQHN